MSVGAFVEGYTTEQEEMDAQWNEFEDIIAKLQMPFFYVRGNHDINMPLTRKAWTERHGPQYYHFIYRNVLFIILDTEDAERPMPPNMEEDITVASAGAAFTYDGPGNVDQLTWVTMTDEGPEIAGIALKGIFDRKGLDPGMFGAYDRAPNSPGTH